MTNLYFNQSPDKKTKNLRPREETVLFLLNYSKALNVMEYKEIKFEALLN